MRPNSSKIREFTELLSGFHSHGVFNPWQNDDPTDAMSGGAIGRRERLESHLSCDARLILIGEAPGYQGCHFSGVAFTSERLIMEGSIPRVSSAFRLSTRARPWSEPSATIVWGALAERGCHHHAVLWNTFAWHPHKPGNLLSNRTPTDSEVAAGAPVLRKFLQLFPGVPVVPVGRIASKTLLDLKVNAMPPVRHPARGGAGEFRAGLGALCSRLGK